MHVLNFLPRYTLTSKKGKANTKKECRGIRTEFCIEYQLWFRKLDAGTCCVLKFMWQPSSKSKIMIKGPALNRNLTKRVTNMNINGRDSHWQDWLARLCEVCVKVQVISRSLTVNTVWCPVIGQVMCIL